MQTICISKLSVYFIVWFFCDTHFLEFQKFDLFINQLLFEIFSFKERKFYKVYNSTFMAFSIFPRICRLIILTGFLFLF